MPDSNGWPTPSDCIDRLEITSAESVTEALKELAEPILLETIAAFQAPVGDGTGGTGRSFTSVTETRYFDGNDRPELRVHDIVPGSALSVVVYAYQLPDVGIRQARPGEPHNILFRRQWIGDGAALIGLVGAQSVALPTRNFPRGIQNIEVTTTWGAEITADIFEAIRCEVCYQLLVGGAIGLNGVGESIEIGDFSLNTSVGAINFKLTSPLTVYHQKYVDAKSNHRIKAPKRFSRRAQKMI